MTRARQIMATNPFITAAEDQIPSGQVLSGSLTNTMLCPVLVLTIQEGRGQNGQGQKKGHKEDQRHGQPAKW